MKGASPREWRFWWGIALFAWALILLLYGIKAYLKTDYTDFDVYLRAATRAMRGEWDLVYTLQDGASPFRYFPFIIPFFVPFTWFSAPIAKVLWCFIQWLSFSAGLFFILRTLLIPDQLQKAPSVTQTKRAQFLVTLSALLGLRLILDSLSIGQVAGPMFLGYAIALYAWVSRQPILFGLGLAIPTLLKLSPGFLFLLPFAKSWEYGVRASKGFLGLVLICCLWLLILLAASPVVSMTSPGFSEVFSTFSSLFSRWLEIVRLDSVYYDASHYGSQSLWSALLRMNQWDWISLATATSLRWIFTWGACGTVFFLWLSKMPVSRGSHLGRAVEFCLGLFLPLLLMPETFKYSLTPLIFPFSVILSYAITNNLKRGEKVVAALLGLTILLTLTLAGKDLLDPLHPRLFFWIQEQNLPFLTLLACFLFFVVLELKQTQWRFFQSQLPETLPLLPLSPPHPQGTENRLTLFVVSRSRETSLYHQQFVHQGLKPIPNSTIKWVERSRLFSEIAECGSEYIGFVNPEQVPVDTFYAEAMRVLDADSACQLVRANRRDTGSRFHVPVKSFSQIYLRHQMGKVFNRLSRFFFGIGVSDTQSEICVFRRSAFLAIGPFLSSDDFMQMLEWSLILKAFNLGEKELPLEFKLYAEKTSSQVLEETVSILRYFPAFICRYQIRRSLARWHPRLLSLNRVTADDWGLSKGVNRAILDLAKRGVLKRASVLVDAGFLHEGLAELCAIPDFEIGLHFNLTYRNPLFLGAISPGSFLLRWLRFGWAGKSEHKRILQKQIQTELRRQIQTLARVLEPYGKRVAYMDGHHHVHIFPGILAICAPVLEELGIQTTRIPFSPPFLRARLFVLNVMAGLSRPAARRLKLRFYPVFYPLPPDYRTGHALGVRILRHAEAEIICHPSNEADVHRLDYPDSYSEGRVAELAFWQWLSYTRRAVCGRIQNGGV